MKRIKQKQRGYNKIGKLPRQPFRKPVKMWGADHLYRNGDVLTVTQSDGTSHTVVVVDENTGAVSPFHGGTQ